jgi:hypothetical protein
LPRLTGGMGSDLRVVRSFWEEIKCSKIGYANS